MPHAFLLSAMPPSRSPLRHSRRLQQLLNMQQPNDFVSMSHTNQTCSGRGRGRGSRGGADPSSSATPRFSIQWHVDTTRTDRLVDFLTSHPADWSILFHDSKKNPRKDSAARPSGKDKNEICLVIARHVFKDNHVYSNFLDQHPKNFQTSVLNRLQSYVTVFLFSSSTVY